MSDDGTNSIDAVIARLRKGFGPDRDLDWDIVEALGGTVRRVSSLGLNGRTPGQWRAFWPGRSDNAKGSQIPYYTNHRDRAIAKLEAMRRAPPPAERGAP